jgi:hypothetical protein
MHAQFIVVPPLTKLTELFTKATGKPFVVGVSWMFWETCTVADFERFRKYIRPSHQKVLDEAVAGTAENPCSLIRQLLRPHNYTIRRGSRNWSLQEVKGKGGEESAEDETPSPRTSIIVLENPKTIEWV